MATQANVETILRTQPAKISSAMAEGAAQDDIRDLINSFLAELADAHHSEHQEITNSLSTMLAELTLAKNELIQLGPNAVSKQDIPGARDQLSAITEVTETAANRIMDAAEKLGEMSLEAGAVDREMIGEISTNLFEASTFQDISGQRITKVLAMLIQLEEGMSRMATLIGDTALVTQNSPEGNGAGQGDHPGTLLEGPQLEGDGNNQDDIDALLASFD